MNKPLEVIKCESVYALERSRATERVRIQPKGSKKGDFAWNRTLFIAAERKWNDEMRIELQVDLVKLFNQLAHRAGYSESGKATVMNGAIKAIVRERMEHDVRLINHEIPEGYEIVTD